MQFYYSLYSFSLLLNFLISTRNICKSEFFDSNRARLFIEIVAAFLLILLQIILGHNYLLDRLWILGPRGTRLQDLKVYFNRTGLIGVHLHFEPYAVFLNMKFL